MDHVVFSEIISESLVPFVNSFGPNFILHQDNCPVHHHAVCRNLLRNENILWVYLKYIYLNFIL